MENAITRILRDETGAVTVDWVVLTGAVMMMGLGVVSTVSDGTLALASKSAAALAAMEVTGGQSSGASGEDLGNGDASFGEDGGGDTPWEAPDQTDWNGMYAGNYWGLGASQAGGNDALARSISLSAARSDAPDGFNLDNPMMSPGENGVVYTSNTGTHYSVNGHVSAIGANGSYVDEWGGTRNVQSWAGN
ncbi:MAG TPA: hypothetical protein DEO85_14285 [Maritimibacter sp.]|nr:hypothetical protein [Maritimibacter sp.]